MRIPRRCLVGERHGIQGTMHMYAAPMIAAVAALTSTAPAGSTSDAPPCFEALTLADAVARAKQKQQFLIVKATAAWCAPCKAMDKTTFRDPRVAAWIKDNGLAIELDVDANTADAKALRIMAMPTMIAYKGDQEFDRIVGFKDADQLMKWLDGVKVGKVHDADLVQKAKDAQDGKAVLSAHERMELADSLLESRRYEAAAAEYAWLWDHIPEEAPELAGVRVSFMADRMEQLVSMHPSAKAKFAALRDAVAVQLKEKPAAAGLRGDWIALNTIVEDEAATLEWIARAATEQAQEDVIRDNLLPIRRLLSREGKWELLGRVLHFPLNEIDDALAMEDEIVRFSAADDSLSGPTKESIRTSARKRLRTLCGEFYAAMLAANRPEAATEVLNRARTIDSSPEMNKTLEDFKAKVSK